MTKIWALIMLLCLTGCSNKAVYNNLQIHERNKCLEELPPTYFECINHDNPSYEEYVRDREAFLEEAKEDKEQNERP